MKNRLQFRYHDQVFDTREAAIEYVQSQIRFAEEGLAKDDPSYGYSLLAEPTVLLYKNVTEEDPEGENNPHLIFVIGSKTNEEGVETGHGQYSDNRFCIIDIDKTEQEIADLAEELEKAIKSLTLIALSSDTLNFYADKTEDGTYVSGDVKVADSYIYEDVRYNNNMMVTPDGLFIYVNLEYDPENEKFKFTVSNNDGTFSETVVDIYDNFLVSGYYAKEDEKIHLQMKNGDEVVVDCEDLIAEWGVEGSNSRTPIMLFKEEVDYDHTDEHHHVEPWQDVLRADIRIKDETYDIDTKKYSKDPRSTNILERTQDGRYLFVDGKASNIIYYMDGEKSNVKAALDKLSKIKISTDTANIIQDRADGFFASTTLEYVSNENMLVFKASGQPTKNIKLNSVEFFKNVYYDPVKEELVITYIDSEGKTQIVRIPIGEMIKDWEWEVQNEGHNVKLVKTRNKSGNDKLSADVKLFEGHNNILVDTNHSLYVRGEADNIKYGENSNVKKEIDNLKATDAALDNKINIEIARAEAAEQALDEKIGEGFNPRNTVRDEIDNLQSEIDAVSADTSMRLTDVINEDESIDVETRNDAAGKPTVKVVKVNLSTEVEDDRKNIIKLNSDGLFANVDLAYEKTANKLIFHTSNGEPDKEIQLESMSSIISMEYNPTKEAIVITYMTNGHEIKTVEIPVGDLINEWRVEDGHPHAVQLEKIRIASGTTEQDVLKASVIISDTHDDNILIMDDGALYVSGQGITDNKAEIDALKERMTTAEDDIDALEDGLREETSARTLADEALDRKIDQEIADRIQDVTDEENRATAREDEIAETARRIGEKLSAEITSARTEEARIEAKLDNEITRSTTKDQELTDALTAEATRALSAETALQTAINNEVTRATDEETRIEARLDDEIRNRIQDVADEEARAISVEDVLRTDLAREIDRAIAKETELNTAITNEALRAQAADNELYQKIADVSASSIAADAQLEIKINEESSARTLADNALEDKIDDEITRSTAEDERLSLALQQEIADREQGDAELAEQIRANKLTFDDTTSIDFNNPYLENNVVTANVKLQQGENIIKCGSGLYATVNLSYDPARNTIKLVTSNGEQEAIQLNTVGSLIDGIEYDPVNRALVVKYHDAAGNQHQTSFPVNQLFNDWIVENPSEKSAIEMTKTSPAEPDDPDKLSARILITDDLNGDGKPDEGSDNLVEIRNNGLYVCGSAMTEAQDVAKCVKNEVKVFEKVVLGHMIGEECGSGYTYEPNLQAVYINSATSFNNADYILDLTINKVSGEVADAKEGIECIDSKADKMYELLYGEGETLANCGEGKVYIPDTTSCVISGATSFMEADRMMAYQICEILEMWVSGETCTTKSDWVDDGANKKMLVDVKLSRGNDGTMTDDEIVIENLNGDYIDPTNKEFTDTNALRIVCLTDGGSVTPAINTPQNGIYLSNVWDCGLYYGPADSQAKAAAAAAGYKTDYETDESEGASAYNYMNNVRRGSDTLC